MFCDELKAENRQRNIMLRQTSLKKFPDRDSCDCELIRLSFSFVSSIFIQSLLKCGVCMLKLKVLISYFDGIQD